MAVGNVGMSLGDIYSMTPEELGMVIEAWQQMRTEESRTSWEQTRFLALCALMPYSKKRLKPTDIVVFEWDKAGKKTEKKTTKEDVARIMARFGDD